jgi:hypothetical protein
MFSEQDVDRELKAALSVSPSPDFEARVLQRVEADRPVLVGVFGVARGLKTAGLLVAAFYALNRTPVVAPQSPQAPPSVAKHAAPTAPGTAPATPKTKEIERPRVEAVSASRRAPRVAEPEVFLPVNQMAAVRRLVRDVNEGRISEIPSESPPAAGEPAEVAVAPLVVEPLVVPAAEARGVISPAVRGL